MQGKKYNRLTPIEIKYRKNSRNYWLCRCDCGNYKIVQESNIKSGAVKSCGCLKAEAQKGNKNSNYKHGLQKTKAYRAWANMKQRCFNSKHPEYSAYGGRGIMVCKDWINNFQAFYDYVSKLPHFGEEGRSIDRINNNGNYEPDNIRWATLEQQYENRGY